MENEHRKLFVMRQLKGANLRLKCTKICLAAGLQLPDSLAAMRGLVVRERGGKGVSV